MKRRIDARCSITVEKTPTALYTDTLLAAPVVVVVGTPSVFIRIVLVICATLLYSRYLAFQCDEISYIFALLYRPYPRRLGLLHYLDRVPWHVRVESGHRESKPCQK